jgi:RimJ/RimL family protein N-acetyltransferase
MNDGWTLRTGRLVLRPVAYADLAELVRLKGDPLVFAVMLGGVRTPEQTARELADDIGFWGAHGAGMWTVRSAEGGDFLGLVGMHGRPDGRGIALRFALHAHAQGRGYASEAAGAALRFAHDRAGLERIVAVARASNIGSRQVLGAIGMRECERYERDGYEVVVFESVAPRRPGCASSICR